MEGCNFIYGLLYQTQTKVTPTMNECTNSQKKEMQPFLKHCFIAESKVATRIVVTIWSRQAVVVTTWSQLALAAQPAGRAHKQSLLTLF